MYCSQQSIQLTDCLLVSTHSNVCPGELTERTVGVLEFDKMTDVKTLGVLHNRSGNLCKVRILILSQLKK